MHRQSLGVILKDNLAVFQTLTVEFAEARSQNLVMHVLHRVIPLDVEIIGESRIQSVLQHVHQHPVLAVIGHVIGNDILEPAHALTLYFAR